MNKYYVVTRQTTQSGTATNIETVSGTTVDEAILNAKIKAYKTMETYKSETSMLDAFVGVTDLNSNTFLISESWKKNSEPEPEPEV